MKPQYLSLADKIFHFHRQKKAKPYEHPIFPTRIRDNLCILKFILQKKYQDILHGNLSRKSTSVQEFGTRLVFSTSDSISQFATNFIKVVKII